MKVLFSGGGTLGPVTPLIAIKDAIAEAHSDATFAWIGTKRGPEKGIVDAAGIPFQHITSGKLRRYLSPMNVVDIAKVSIGFVQSCYFMLKHDPDVCITAGGFVSVPVHIAAWLFGVQTWVHQQDVVPGLANKVMSRFATVVTTALESSVAKFPKNRTVWLGNPVRNDIYTGSFDRAVSRFSLDPTLPVVFATGGGTGSMRVNQLIVEAVGHLGHRAQVIHLTGKERPQELAKNAEKQVGHYQVFDFFTNEMKDAYAAADIVVSRGGFGTITELAALGKVAILVPKPGHQVDNVRFLTDSGAAVLINEETADGNQLAKIIRDLLSDETQMEQMSKTLKQVLPIASKAKIVSIFDELQ